MCDINQLSLEEKYQILTEYTKSNGLYDEDETDVIVHEGKTYRKVQIEGRDEEYLMDEDENIYDLNLKKIGNAGGSDGEDDAAF